MAKARSSYIENNPDVYARIISMYDSGLSYTEITRLLRSEGFKVTQHTVRRAILNEIPINKPNSLPLVGQQAEAEIFGNKLDSIRQERLDSYKRYKAIEHMADVRIAERLATNPEDAKMSELTSVSLLMFKKKSLASNQPTEIVKQYDEADVNDLTALLLANEKHEQSIESDQSGKDSGSAGEAEKH